jgi:hypothetical protein
MLQVAQSRVAELEKWIQRERETRTAQRFKRASRSTTVTLILDIDLNSMTAFGYQASDFIR